MPPKRKRSGDSENVDESKRYAYLKPSIRRIPEKTIKAKWSTLPEPVQDKVRDLFHSLERPVIVRQPNEKKRIEAQSAVNAVVRKYVVSALCVLVASRPRLLCCLCFAVANILLGNSLGRRLPRMPFPPITKDSSFDYETALNEHVGGFLLRMKSHAKLVCSDRSRQTLLR